MLRWCEIFVKMFWGFWGFWPIT